VRLASLGSWQCGPCGPHQHAIACSSLPRVFQTVAAQRVTACYMCVPLSDWRRLPRRPASGPACQFECLNSADCASRKLNDPSFAGGPNCGRTFAPRPTTCSCGSNELSHVHRCFGFSIWWPETSFQGTRPV
jgi:hypothetical protein